MPEVDISKAVPPTALWVKVQYWITPKKPGANLIARLWSGVMDDAVIIKGETGFAFVKLKQPQKLSYQNPVTVNLKLKVVAFKSAGENPPQGEFS